MSKFICSYRKGKREKKQESNKPPPKKKKDTKPIV